MWVRMEDKDGERNRIKIVNANDIKFKALTKGHVCGSRPEDHRTHRIQTHALFNNHFRVDQFLEHVKIGGLIRIIEHLL